MFSWKNITSSECVSVALFIQNAERMRRVILSSVTCLAVAYLSSLSLKQHDFRKNYIERKICVLLFSTTLSEMTVILRRNEGHVIIYVYWSSCKVLVIPKRF